jgi:hypothetical protein
MAATAELGRWVRRVMAWACWASQLGWEWQGQSCRRVVRGQGLGSETTQNRYRCLAIARRRIPQE